MYFQVDRLLVRFSEMPISMKSVAIKCMSIPKNKYLLPVTLYSNDLGMIKI